MNALKVRQSLASNISNLDEDDINVTSLQEEDELLNELMLVDRSYQK